ncbi:dessication-induced 1VOC superfamily protein [Wolffia australiana]
MAARLKPAFAYAVVYVKDVAEMVEFYAKAFGYEVRRLDDARRWGELAAGETTIAFTPARQHETDAVTGVVRLSVSPRERPPIELCFVYDDVDRAFQRAVENGAAPVAMPEEKPWGQKVGYVRDPDGNVIRLGSPVRAQ